MWLDSTRGQRASGINLTIRDRICLREGVLAADAHWIVAELCLLERDEGNR